MMSEQTNIDGNVDGSEDSSVIREMREQIKGYKSKAEAFDKARAEAATAELIGQGFGGLTDVYLDKVEGFPTRERVGEFLTGLGLAKAESPDTGESEPGGDRKVPDETTPLSQVANLGQQVATAATQQGESTLSSALEGAESAKEVANLMKAAGLQSW